MSRNKAFELDLNTAMQCSQSSGAPVGPGGGTAKSPGRDGTTKCRPSSSLNFQDGKPHDLRHILVGDGRGRLGEWRTAGDGRGRQGTAENSGKQRKTAEDGGGRWGTVLHSDVWGKFQKRPDGTTECRPSSSLILTCRATLETD